MHCAECVNADSLFSHQVTERMPLRQKSYRVGVRKERYVFYTGQEEVPSDQTDDREHIVCIGA